MKNVIIYPCKEAFHFGSCASLAISSAFDINRTAFKAICKVLKIEDWDEGITYIDCLRLINLLSDKKAIYTSNYAKVVYSQLILMDLQGKYIVMFDNHLSYMENSKVYDSYLLGHNVTKYKPVGWWKIT